MDRLKILEIFPIFVYKIRGGDHLRVLHKSLRLKGSSTEPHDLSPKQPTVELLSLVLWDSYTLIPTKPYEMLV